MKLNPEIDSSTDLLSGGKSFEGLLYGFRLLMSEVHQRDIEDVSAKRESKPQSAGGSILGRASTEPTQPE